MSVKNKEEVTVTFAGRSGISLNGRRVTRYNINEFVLHRVDSECNDYWDVYTIQEGEEDFFVVMYKEDGKVDWVESLY